MTPAQLHILQHSLGLDQYGQGDAYRNHYVAGPDCDGYEECRALVDVGMMEERRASDLTGGMPCFIVTTEGIDYVRRKSERAPKLSRGQRRYREWLRADSGLSFGEWLRQQSRRSA